MRLAAKCFFLSLAVVGGSALAQQRYGDWTVSRQDYGYVASTVNDDGEAFGKICYTNDQTCVWAFTDKLDCADSGQSPALMVTNKGAVHVTLHCIKSGDGKGHSIAPFDSVEIAAQATSRIAIAIPMDDGLVKVVRFSLTGSSSATAAAEAATKRTESKSTRPLTL